MVSTSTYVELVSARSSGINVGHIVRSVSMHMVSNRRKKMDERLAVSLTNIEIMLAEIIVLLKLQQEKESERPTE